MQHPFTCIVAGPTKAGKTTFVKKLIESPLINPAPAKIWWCFSEQQPLYDKMPRKVAFVKGGPDLGIIRQYTHQPQLIILDDLMQEMKNNPQLVQLFTRGCHHWNISIIHIVQNVFFDGLRTSRINSDYLVLFKNPADQLQAQTLARQLFPTNTKYFLEAYSDSTKSPHGYLFIDLTQYTEDLYRLKTNIFEPYPTVYIPKGINTNN